jgi:DNA-directed RNA polymerase subunit omega
MRDSYIKDALKVIDDPNILVNVVSLRVKQLRRGHRALVESLEHLSAEDTALREIAEGKITYEQGPPEIEYTGNLGQVRNVVRPLSVGAGARGGPAAARSLAVA